MAAVRRSWVWGGNYFDTKTKKDRAICRIKIDRKTKQVDPNGIVCECELVWKPGGPTSNLASHLKVHGLSPLEPEPAVKAARLDIPALFAGAAVRSEDKSFTRLSAGDKIVVLWLSLPLSDYRYHYQISVIV